MFIADMSAVTEYMTNYTSQHKFVVVKPMYK